MTEIGGECVMEAQKEDTRGNGERARERVAGWKVGAVAIRHGDLSCGRLPIFSQQSGANIMWERE